VTALEDQRDFLLRSLDDLEREHDAGDVDDVDYETLKDDYTARAARTIRSIEAREAKAAAVASGRPRRSWRRLVLTVAGVAAFALLAGVLVAQAAGRRGAGEALTGDIRETTRAKLENALSLAADGHYDEAIKVYDGVLDDQPDNVEAMTFKGWFQLQSGDGQGVVTLIDAVAIDPDYPATHAFLAVAFEKLGRDDTAREEIARLDALDPPPQYIALTGPLRTRLGLPASPTATTAPTTTAPATTAPPAAG
jgi:tetratricopeptide (TPR) repeat protein